MYYNTYRKKTFGKIVYLEYYEEGVRWHDTKRPRSYGELRNTLIFSV